MSFKQFLLNEADPMGMPPPGAPPMGGGMNAPPPGAPPMGGGMPPPGGGLGGPPGLGGGMGDPMGGAPPMGGAGGPQAQIPLKMKNTDVWSVIKELLQGDQSSNKTKNMIQSPDKKSNKHLLA